jgi:hypothetical protein
MFTRIDALVLTYSKLGRFAPSISLWEDWGLLNEGRNSPL